MVSREGERLGVGTSRATTKAQFDADGLAPFPSFVRPLVRCSRPACLSVSVRLSSPCQGLPRFLASHGDSRAPARSSVDEAATGADGRHIHHHHPVENEGDTDQPPTATGGTRTLLHACGRVDQQRSCLLLPFTPPFLSSSSSSARFVAISSISHAA